MAVDVCDLVISGAIALTGQLLQTNETVTV